MNEKKKRLLLFGVVPAVYVMLPIVFIIILFCSPFIIELLEAKKYWKSSNWNLDRETFLDSYYSQFEEQTDLYFLNNNSFSKVNETRKKSEDDVVEYCSERQVISFDFDCSSSCCFLSITIKTYSSNKTNLLIHNRYEFIDCFITGFASKNFYDYEIFDSILLDAMNRESYSYYFDNWYGNLGSNFIIRAEGDEYVSTINIRTFLKGTKFIKCDRSYTVNIF